MKANKQLGQHFLTSKKARDAMVAAADITPGEDVLEIGPGRGVLTRALLDAGARVVAVEIDPGMTAYLEEHFADEVASGALRLIEGDIRTTTPRDLEFSDRDYKVVANIPYYITGEIVRALLTAKRQPASLTLLVQKEVGERIARSSKETLLSLSVKAYGIPRYVETVPARYFNPSPQVDSAIVHVADISRDFFLSPGAVRDSIPEEKFFTVVKAGFSSKRKQLANNLASFGSKEHIAHILRAIGLRSDVRAEDVSLTEWREIARALS